VLVVEVRSGDPLEISDRLKQQHAPAAVIVGARDDGTAQLVINVDRALEARGVHAGNVIREVAPLVGGGGGGRPTMARAGGKQPERLGDALAEAERLILGALGA
jgi:alanyl-tRNA synthetase